MNLPGNTRFALHVLTLGFWISTAAQPMTGASQSVAASGPPPRTPGLSVSRDGVLLRGGKPWRGIGVNMAHTLEEQGMDAAFDTLAKFKIPFARVFGGEYFPLALKQYQQDRDGYFARYDRLVRAAETHRVGLIPSLFWDPSTVPAMVGERVSQWGNASSKTRQFMREYTRDFVSRYKDSPAIWGWEFGNEYNLVSDLPKLSWWQPTFRPDGAQSKQAETADQLTYEIVRSVFQDFAGEVRKLDPSRIISSGFSIPRKSAWHLRREKSWTDDTPQQFEMVLAGIGLSSQDVISIHAYDDDVARIPQVMRAGAKLGKPVFLGEFGVGGETDATRTQFQNALAVIEREKVPLAALWVYHRPRDEGSWNVSETNARSYQLEAIARSNQKIRDELGFPWPGDW